MLDEMPPGTYGELGAGWLIGYGMRLALYVAALILVVYLGNLTERELPQLRLVRMLGVLFLTAVAGGLLGVFVPGLSFTSPLELVLPDWISEHPFVQNLVHPTAGQTQKVLGHALPRPEAPFEWANAWGGNLSVLLIWFVVGWWVYGSRRRRMLAVALVAVAAVPIVYSLNRGAVDRARAGRVLSRSAGGGPDPDGALRGDGRRGAGVRAQPARSPGGEATGQPALQRHPGLHRLGHRRGDGPLPRHRLRQHPARHGQPSFDHHREDLVVPRLRPPAAGQRRSALAAADLAGAHRGGALRGVLRRGDPPPLGRPLADRAGRGAGDVPGPLLHARLRRPGHAAEPLRDLVRAAVEEHLMNDARIRLIYLARHDRPALPRPRRAARLHPAAARPAAAAGWRRAAGGIRAGRSRCPRTGRSPSTWARCSAPRWRPWCTYGPRAGPTASRCWRRTARASGSRT
ncbi:hypothetical protein ACFSTC_04490 [Nonomuraea ferruginea]